jgi:hypothetical protein
VDTQAVNEVLFAVSREEPTTPAPATGPVDKTFRTYDRDQQFLLPPSITDWVPEGHLARFIDELVEEVLDLAPFYASYTETRGYPPYAPRLMIKLLSTATSPGSAPPGGSRRPVGTLSSSGISPRTSHPTSARSRASAAATSTRCDRCSWRA